MLPPILRIPEQRISGEPAPILVADRPDRTPLCDSPDDCDGEGDGIDDAATIASRKRHPRSLRSYRHRRSRSS
ncbi:MAG TPA: hypothetical protein VLA69_04340, partial [Gaiellaceae bacterium]|nr:hypothetical protein [Gaiellaceae bacterium]